MKIVGIVNSKEEAFEIQGIAKRFILGNRVRELAKQIRK